ncbi:MAG: stage V sporulation protein S [Roseiflexaceae bacterium]
MGLDTHNTGAADAASKNISTSPEEERMVSNTTQSAPVARAVGASSTQTIERQPAEVLKVSTRSRPSAVAGAIAGVIRDNGMAEVQSIGAGATNQAIKAVAIARSYLSEEGIEIVCVPSFIDVAIDDEERTAIRLLIERR